MARDVDSECPHCGKSFASRPTLRKHIYSAHLAQQPRPLVKRLDARAAQIRPRQSKTRTGGGKPSFVCSECGASYPSREGLRRHIFIAHIGDATGPRKEPMATTRTAKAGRHPVRPPRVRWDLFFSGDYGAFTRERHAGPWLYAGRVHITFKANTSANDGPGHDGMCLQGRFRHVGPPTFTLPGVQYFHLRTLIGNHISATDHPGNWHGHIHVPYLDGGVMEGPSIAKRYLRLGLTEATDSGEDTWYSTGMVRVKFEGKEYEPRQKPTIQVRLLGAWKRKRPASNYPWNTPKTRPARTSAERPDTVVAKDRTAT